MATQPGTESMDAAASTYSTNTATKDEDESWEEVSVSMHGAVTVVDLPSRMTEDRAVLDMFFRPEIWEQHSSQELKKRLWSLLPFDRGVDPSEALRALVDDEDIRFGRNCLRELKEEIIRKEATPIKVEMRSYLLEAERKQYQDKLAEQAYTDLKQLAETKMQMMAKVGTKKHSMGVGGTMTRKSVAAAFDVQFEVGREYLSALSSVMSKLDGNKVELTSDQHIYPDGLPKQRHRDNKRPRIQIAQEVLPPQRPNEETSLNNDLSNRSELESSESCLSASPSSRLSPRRPPSSQRLPPRPPPPPPPKPVKDKAVVDEAVANIPGMAPPSTDIDLTEAIEEDSAPPLPPCFFVLLRDIVFGGGLSNILISEVQQKVRSWVKSNGALCLWTKEIDEVDWSEEVASAVAFLCGILDSETMPPDYKPYMSASFAAPSGDDIRCSWVKSSSGEDIELGALNSWWIDKRSKGYSLNHLLTALREQDKANRVKAERKQKAEFECQESNRFAQPNNCFVYRCRGKEFLVGPVQNSSVKPDPPFSNRLVRPEAPVAASFSQLVRDAVCRLPNLNRGSAAKIADLVSESGYLRDGIAEASLLGEVRRTLTDLCGGAIPFVIAEDRTGPDGQVIYQYSHIGKTRKQLVELNRQCQAVRMSGQTEIGVPLQATKSSESVIPTTPVSMTRTNKTLLKALTPGQSLLKPQPSAKTSPAGTAMLKPAGNVMSNQQIHPLVSGPPLPPQPQPPSASSVSAAANAAIRQVLAAGPSSPPVAAATIQLPVTAGGSQVKTATIPYLNLSGSSTSEVMKIISNVAAASQQQQQLQFAPRPQQQQIRPPQLQQQQLQFTPRPQQQQQQQQLRIQIGQRVAMNGRQYTVLGIDAAGQAILAPCEPQQQQQQHFVIQQPQQQMLLAGQQIVLGQQQQQLQQPQQGIVFQRQQH